MDCFKQINVMRLVTECIDILLSKKLKTEDFCLQVFVMFCFSPLCLYGTHFPSF